MPTLQVWNDSIDLETIIENMPDKENKRFYSRKLAKATEQSAHEKEFAKLTFTAGDTPRIVDQPPLIYHYGDVRDKELLQDCHRHPKRIQEEREPGSELCCSIASQVVDVAFKVVGVGSVGTVCGIVLMMSGRGDPLFLQFKQARQSVLEPYCGANPYTHAGQRVVVGQRAMQTAGDVFLGWATGTGERKVQFYLRQLSDAKIKPVIEIDETAQSERLTPACAAGCWRGHMPVRATRWC